MKTQSTYSLLVQSQEKGRSIFEAAVNSIFVLSTILAIVQFASYSVIVPVVAEASATSTLVAKADSAPINARG